ncbi:MAG: haloacid dehalogenase-like hydrolase [Thermodesulfobacteriota bacterium]|nr:MAG: haloacid dehalogenase-like hydrolase [Thermodesulfobacteriota bacterium]
MRRSITTNIALVSCDLNGTLVHQHTMMDMIRVYFPDQPERFKKAKEAFNKQTSGLLSMKEAFAIAGPLTRGLSLRNAIRYAVKEMNFLEGFELFISTLYEKGIYFIINSTGYSITTEVIKAIYGPEKIYAVICNRLIFGWGGRNHKVIDEAELSQRVKKYFRGSEKEKSYDEILATGQVKLGIQDEREKVNLLFTIADTLKIPRQAIAHIGDTMGDSVGISDVARNGGLGIAFNYNQALKNYLEKILKNENFLGTILLIEPKKETSSLKLLSDIILSYSS